MFEIQPPLEDGLLVSDVGRWSIDKHHFLQRYIDIFTTGMKNKKFNLHYVDLFAGAGVENVKGEGLAWGSALLAAQAPNRFHRLHLCEKHKEKYEALSARISHFPQPRVPQLLRGDTNRLVDQIASQIPPRGTLTLAFLDPYGLQLYFETLKALTSNRKMDLMIYFPDRVDILRNLHVYTEQTES